MSQPPVQDIRMIKREINITPYNATLNSKPTISNRFSLKSPSYLAQENSFTHDKYGCISSVILWDIDCFSLLIVFEFNSISKDLTINKNSGHKICQERVCDLLDYQCLEEQDMRRSHAEGVKNNLEILKETTFSSTLLE